MSLGSTTRWPRPSSKAVRSVLSIRSTKSTSAVASRNAPSAPSPGDPRKASLSPATTTEYSAKAKVRPSRYARARDSGCSTPRDQSSSISCESDAQSRREESASVPFRAALRA